MTDYARLVKLAWGAYKPFGECLRKPFPLGTRFAFRRDEHRRLRACFIEYDDGGLVDMIASYQVDEERKPSTTPGCIRELVPGATGANPRRPGR